jgi:cyanophycinase
MKAFNGFAVKVMSLAFALILANPAFSAGDPEIPPAKNQFKGSLFLIGGAADSTLSDFVKLAGGSKANIAIITHASSEPDKTGDACANDFASLGVKHTTIIVPGHKGGLPKDCNAVFICGGDQNRLLRLLDDPLPKQLRTFLKDGGLIGGSSAGAACAAVKMIAGGMSDKVIRPNSLLLADGLGLLEGVVIDTHVGARSRDCRSMVAITMLDDILAIGLDEDTAIYVSQGKAVVYGAGHVRLFRASPGKKAVLKLSQDKTRGSVSDVLVSYLTAGDEFDVPR